MRRSPVFHLSVGALVVMCAALVGQIASERVQRDDPYRDSYRCQKRRAIPPSSSGYSPTWQAQGIDAPSRVIVKFRGGPDTAALKRLIAGLGSMPGYTGGPGAFTETFDALPGVAVLGYTSTVNAERALRAFRNDSRVEYAEMDAVWHVDQSGATAPRRSAGTPSDARYVEQWGLENVGQGVNGHPGGTPGVDIGAPDAWQISQGTDEVVVAVIDSGVDYDHEDLAANMWTNPDEIPNNGIDDDNNGVIDDVHGYNAADDSGDPDDDLGHGTHVAGTIGAVGDNDQGVAGVNWTTRIMALKFLGPTGGGTTSDAIACIDYMLTMKERGANVRVVNCSWGSTEYSRALEDAIDRATRQGIMFVCASGNDSVDTDRVPHYPSSYDLEGVVSVAALAPNDTLAGFSNWGASSVDIAAPGVDIVSTIPDDGYGFASGTSMASPHVAGVAALVASQDPGMPLSELRDHLLDGAVDVADFASKLVTGGRLSGPGAFGGN